MARKSEHDDEQLMYFGEGEFRGEEWKIKNDE